MLTNIFLITGIGFFVLDMAWTIKEFVEDYREKKAAKLISEEFFSKIFGNATEVSDESDTKQEKKNTKKAKE